MGGMGWQVGGRFKREGTYVCTVLYSVASVVIPSTIAHQAPPSVGFSRQEYWSGLPFPPPGDLPDLGIEPTAPASLALQADSLLLSHQGSPDIRKLMADSCGCTTETNAIWQSSYPPISKKSWSKASCLLSRGISQPW